MAGTKWKVEYDSAEKIAKGEVTLFKQPKGSYENVPIEEVRILVIWFDEFAVKSMFDFSGKETLNSKFPDIKPVEFQDLIEGAWGTKHST